ncbi:MAG TPA: MFS transporter [Hyphomicrobiales bacterium]|nr:MFS transporter [Hyphomicrobiales bacterium]
MLTVKPEIKQNWSILLMAFVLIFCAFGIPTYSLPYMYTPAMEEFGWSNAEVQLLSSAKFLVGAGAALGMGILVDLIGGRLAVLIGTVSGGIALTLFLGATSLPVYYLAGGLLGLSASSIVAAMKIVISRIFTIHQGFAMGIVLSGTSFGGVVMPLVWEPLLSAGYNWRHIAAFMSIGAFLVATPLWLIYMARSGSVQDTVKAHSVAEAGKPGMWEHFKQISRERGFWFIALGIFLVSAVDQAMMQNYVSFLRADKGIQLSAIAWAGSFMAVMGVISKVGSGWFYDRFSIPGIRFTYLLLAISVALGLPVVGAASLFLFLTVRGIAHGGLIVEAPIIVKHYLGSRNLGMTIGVISVFINLGFAAGPPLLGWFADHFGNYTVGFIVYAVLAFIGMLLLVPIKPRYWIPPSQRREEEEVKGGGEQLRPATP